MASGSVAHRGKAKAVEAVYLKLPKYERQFQTWTCWAAGCHSRFDLKQFGRKPTQQELIDEYATHPNGGLDPVSRGGTAHRDFDTLANDFGLDFVVVPGQSLTYDGIETRLRQFGHLLLIYNLSPGVSHANVVYGVGYPDGKNRRISVMDPSVTTPEPPTGLYRNRSIGFYNQRDFILISWLSGS